MGRRGVTGRWEGMGVPLVRAPIVGPARHRGREVGQGQNRERMRGRLREGFKAEAFSFQTQPEVTSENFLIFT